MLNTGIIYLKGMDNVASPYDLSNIGLNVFFSPEMTGTGIYSFLSEVSLFAIWYIVIVAIGLMSMANMDKVKAGIASTLSWLIITGFKVGLMVMGASFSMT
ncbi:hypothetical protein JYT44_02050, partial [Caldithrix abyssi]|nr:hypothetical protein [Caldithrix abyssi]